MVGKDSVIREIVLGRRLLLAPWRRLDPISSSSKSPTSLIMLLLFLLSSPPPCVVGEELDAIRASMAEKLHSRSSIRPAKMNSFSRPPSCAGWMSNSSSSQLMILLSANS